MHVDVAFGGRGEENRQLRELNFFNKQIDSSEIRCAIAIIAAYLSETDHVSLCAHKLYCFQLIVFRTNGTPFDTSGIEYTERPVIVT